METAKQTQPAQSTLLQTLTIVSLIGFIGATVMGFVYPGVEQTMGEVQRLFYIHLGSFFGAFILFFGAVVGGIAYLATRKAKWDRLAFACIEVALAMSAVTIVTGMFWARPIWGAYWTWDPRLTTIAIMWLSYAAYLFLRGAIEDPEQRRRFASVYGILAFGSVILTVVIIRVRPDVIHPVVAGPTTSSSADALGSFNVTDTIRNTVYVNIIAYILLSVVMVWHRIRLEERTEQVQAHKHEVLANL